MQIAALELADSIRCAEIDCGCNIPPWSGLQFENEFSLLHSHSWGAWLDGSLLGFLVCHISVDEAHIVTLGVDDTCRRQGIGRELLSHCLHELQQGQVSQVTLEVRESNTAAHALYNSFGFAQVSIRREFYRLHREDGLVLSLPLDRFVSLSTQ